MEPTTMALLATSAAGILGGLLGKKQKAPELPWQQKAAMEGLLNFSSTGRLGDYQAGEAYTGSLGDFALSGLEQSGLDLLQGRLGSQDATMYDLLNTDKYDPLKTGGVYDQLRGRIQRGTREATDEYKRSSAYMGNLYSTDAQRGLADIQARGAETEAVTMANLYDNYVQRRLNAAPVMEEMTRGRISDAFAYGQVPRNLKTAEAQSKYGEFQRQRQEKAGRVDALKAVMGGPIMQQQPASNPWTSVLNALGQFGGSYLANKDWKTRQSPDGLPMGMI